MKIHPLRDCKAWGDEGLELGTTSNEAARYYDACLAQIVGWYDEPQVGGIVKTIEHLFNADPDFVLGRALRFGLRVIGTQNSISTSAEVRKEYDALVGMMEEKKDSMSNREFMHLKAILLWAEGKLSSAVKLWEEILLDFPTDIHAVKLSNITYFYLGEANQMRDSIARILPVWESKKPPMKGLIYGMYAFGLEESNQFEKAELYAKKGLEEEKEDGWSTHALAHVYEMEGRTAEGIKFMTSTAPNWEKSNHLACHNNWHLALYHIENEDYASAVTVLEDQVIKRATVSKTMLDVVDTSSLLYRLHLLNPSVCQDWYWEKALEVVQTHSKSHVTTFNDAHFMMTFSGSKKSDLADDLLANERPSGELSDHAIVSVALLEAIRNFEEGNYGKTVETLEPIRYKLHAIGGSNAQRDVFNLLLIVAALKSNNEIHKKLATALINERESFKHTSLGRKLQFASTHSQCFP